MCHSKKIHKYIFYDVDEDGNFVPPENREGYQNGGAGFSPALTPEHQRLLSKSINKHSHSTEAHSKEYNLAGVQKMAVNDGRPGNYEIKKRPNSSVENK